MPVSFIVSFYFVEIGEGTCDRCGQWGTDLVNPMAVRAQGIDEPILSGEGYPLELCRACRDHMIKKAKESFRSGQCGTS